MKIDLDTPLSAPAALGFGGLIVLTMAALVGVSVPTEAWGAWVSVIVATLTGAAWRGRNGNGSDDA